MLSLESRFTDLRQRKQAIVAETFRVGQQLYRQASAAYRDGWLAAHANRYVAIRWRERARVTALGELRLPVRVVRADRLMSLRWLQSDRRNWQHWWNRTCLSTAKANPGWATTDN